MGQLLSAISNLTLGLENLPSSTQLEDFAPKSVVDAERADREP